VLHMVKGDYAIFNMAQPNREQAVERVHQVCACQGALLGLLIRGYDVVQR
jgi:hypothetical protein